MENNRIKQRFQVPSWLKRFLPVIVSASILYYYFHDQDWVGFFEACSRADILIALISLLIPLLIFWLLSALMVQRHMQWFHGPLPFKPLFWIRGATYILSFVNVNLGEGGLLIYQQRKTGISWRKLMGILLFRAGLLLWGIGFLMIPATLAMYHYGIADKVKINLTVWWWILISGALFCFSTFAHWRYGYGIPIITKLIVRDEKSEFWSAYRNATGAQWLLTWAMGLPPVVLTIGGAYFLNRAFNVNVPFVEFMVVGPIAFTIMDLPLAFGGFGTATMAWMMFFGDYGTETDIAALTLFLPFARAAMRASIGLISLPAAMKEIEEISRPKKVE